MPAISVRSRRTAELWTRCARRTGARRPACCARCPRSDNLVSMTFLWRIMWAAVACLGAVCLGAIAIERGEPVNSVWLVLAAICSYLIGYRFYAKFVAARVMALNDERATPAERLDN